MFDFPALLNSILQYLPKIGENSSAHGRLFLVAEFLRESRSHQQENHVHMAGVRGCGCDVTVSLRMTILELVLGYLAISIEVPDRGLLASIQPH